MKAVAADPGNITDRLVILKRLNDWLMQCDRWIWVQNRQLAERLHMHLKRSNLIPLFQTRFLGC